MTNTEYSQNLFHNRPLTALFTLLDTFHVLGEFCVDQMKMLSSLYILCLRALRHQGKHTTLT